MKVFLILLSITFLSACTFSFDGALSPENTQKLRIQTETHDSKMPIQTGSESTGNVAPIEIQKANNNQSQTTESFSLPTDYTLRFTTRTGSSTSFMYPQLLNIEENYEEVSTGRVMHGLDIAGFSDKSIRMYIYLPDSAEPFAGAPYFERVENIKTVNGKKMKRKLSWVSQDSNLPDAVGSWELEYSLGKYIINIIQDDQIHGDGYKKTIDPRIEELAQNILYQVTE